MERLLLIERAFFCSGAEDQSGARAYEQDAGCEAEDARETGFWVKSADQDRGGDSAQAGDSGSQSHASSA